MIFEMFKYQAGAHFYFQIFLAYNLCRKMFQHADNDFVEGICKWMLLNLCTMIVQGDMTKKLQIY